jgi:nicotinamide-nucleotide amidase
MFDPELLFAAERLLTALRSRGWHIATAESCTGGLIAGLLTEIPGSSDVVDRGFVTYSNAAKVQLLGVPQATIAAHGAVSRETALAMAQGARNRAGVEVSIAVTGVAGPGGGSAGKPVGLVYIAVATPQETRHRECRFGDIGRSGVRIATVASALALIEEAIAASATR